MHVRLAPIAVLTVVAAATLAGAWTVSLNVFDDTDYRSLPPRLDAVEGWLGDAAMTLEQAVEHAKDRVPGVVRSAVVRFDDENRPYAEIEILADNKAQRLVISMSDATVIEQTPVGWLPGRYAEGDLVEFDGGIGVIDMIVGEGDQITDTWQTVKIHYEAYLVNGRRFDSSDRNAVPVRVTLDHIFLGFSRGVMGMKVGGVRKVVIPPDLAFGEHGSPPTIPANATIIFDIELIDIVDYTTIPDELPGDPVEGEGRVLESGIVIYDLVEGEGDPVRDVEGHVSVHFAGYLTDGTKFQDTRDFGQPLDSPLANLIEGWQQGIIGMKPGGKRKIVVPYQYGYGEYGHQDVIPPRATLIFDIELVEARSR